MAIKKFNRKEHDPEYFSKTANKNEAQAIKKFGQELLALSAEKLKQLPIQEVTLKSLLDGQKITTNLAKKRHLMFIGKCLRIEDEALIRQSISDDKSGEFKKKAIAEESKIDPMDELVAALLANENVEMEILLEKYPNIERQTLRQLLRNRKNAKVANKKQQVVLKLKQYLAECIS